MTQLPDYILYGTASSVDQGIILIALATCQFLANCQTLQILRGQLVQDYQL